MNIKKIFSVLAAACLICTACACQKDSGDDNSSKDDGAASQSVEQSSSQTVESQETSDECSEASMVDEELKKYGYSGVVVAVKDGKTLYSGSFNDNNDGQVFDSKTVFRIASVSKQFCAAGVLLLEEQGKLSVNDTLEKYFPEYIHAKEVTIHDLLSTRSGIPDYHDEKEFKYFDQSIFSKIVDENGEYHFPETSEGMKELAMEMINTSELMFKPGEKYEYSNTNFHLAALIIEKVSGKRYEDFISESFFKPLHMDMTGFFDDYSVPGAVFAKSASDDGNNIDIKLLNLPVMYFGSGDIVSNAEDLLKWAKAYEGGSVLSDAIIKKMTTNYSGAGERTYGYGLKIDKKGFGHDGMFLTYRTYLYTCPEEKATAVLLMNEDNEKIYDLRSYIQNVVLKIKL